MAVRLGPATILEPPWPLSPYSSPRLQLADFNFDGYTDVLLVSHDGIWAWAQVRGWRARVEEASRVLLHQR